MEYMESKLHVFLQKDQPPPPPNKNIYHVTIQLWNNETLPKWKKNQNKTITPPPKKEKTHKTKDKKKE